VGDRRGWEPARGQLAPKPPLVRAFYDPVLDSAAGHATRAQAAAELAEHHARVVRHVLRLLAVALVVQIVIAVALIAVLATT
jgi:hypothetical protein